MNAEYDERTKGVRSSRGNGRIISSLARAALMAAALGTCTLQARDYFFDASTGSDDADGSEAHPLRTIAHANRMSFEPADRILFQGGQTFTGNLIVTDASHSSAAEPIVIGSTGDGRATIDAGPGTGIWVRNTGGVVIQDLVVFGSGAGNNVGTGVRVENTLKNTVTLEYVRILRVTCSGFGGYPGPIWNEYGGPSNYGEGFFVGGRPYDFSKSGYHDVRIEDCEAYDNQYYGILVSGAWNPSAETLANRDVHVVHCLTHHNPGDPKYRENHSGNGILLEEVDGGTIERSQAWENGALCASAAGGPVGIWAATANRIIIRECVAFSNHSSSLDGGGFDLDGGVSNSVIEHCTSHDNDGAGILLYSYAGAPYYFGGNIARNNLCANDGKKNGMAGIAIGRHGGRFEGVEICDNVIFASGKAGSTHAVSVFGVDAKEIRFHDNVIVASNGAHLIDIVPQPGITLSDNVYWSGSFPFAIVFGGHEYGSVAGLREGTGQEPPGTNPAQLAALFSAMPGDKLSSWLEATLASALIAIPEHHPAGRSVTRRSLQKGSETEAAPEQKPKSTFLEMLSILAAPQLTD